MDENISVVTINDYAKLDMRVGLIESCEKVENSEKLLKMQVDFGTLGKRQILAGIALWYKPEDMQGTQAIFVTNLEYRKLMGLESQGMILAAGGEDGEAPALLRPSKKAKPGSRVR